MRDASCSAGPDVGPESPVQWFKSVMMLLEPDAAGSNLSVDADVLCRWLERYDDAYRSACGMADGVNLHLLYHRSVEVMGPRLLTVADRLRDLGTTCYRLGLGFAATFSLADALEHRSRLEGLLASGKLHHLGLNAAIGPHVDAAPARELIEWVSGQNVKLGLLGPIGYYRSTGLLESGILNRTDVTLYPVGAGLLDGEVIPKHPSIPCFARFRVFVDTSGDIYPCLGLLGLPSAKLGSVHDTAVGAVFAGGRTALDLGSLSRRGPALPALPSGGKRLTSLPWVCEQHRLAVLRDESPREPQREALRVGSGRAEALPSGMA